MEFRIDVVVNPQRAVAGAKRTTDSLRRVQTQANSLHTALRRAFLLLGAGALIRNALGTLTSFEQAMSTVAAVTGATTQVMENFRKQAQELGITTRFTATQAAEALVTLSRAGFSAGEAAATLPQVLNLAQSAGVGLATAADIAASALRSFGIEATDSSRVADVLTKASNSANTTLVGLGDALKFVGPIARTAGVSLEETSAAIGALSDAGLKGTLAGTGLRRILAELLQPTAKNAERFKQLGLQANELSDILQKDGLTAALDRLRQTGLQAGEGLRIFGQRGGPAFEVLVANIPKIRELNTELENSGGVAATTARIMDDNLNGAVIRAKSAFDGLVLALGDVGATGGLRSFFENLATLFRTLAANAEVFGRALLALATTMATGLGINFVIGRLAALRIALLSNPITLIPTILAAAVGAFVAFGDEIKVTSDGVASLQDVVSVAFNAIKETVAPILDGLSVLLRESFGPDATLSIRTFVEGSAALFDALVGAARGAVFVVTDLFTVQLGAVMDGSLAVLQRGGLKLKAFFEDLGNGIANLFREPLKTIARAIKSLISSIGGVAAVARSLGIISEESRLSVEDAISGVEAALSRLDTRPPPNIFNTEKTKAEIAKLDGEIQTIFNKIGQGLASSFKEGFDQSTLLDFVKAAFDEAEQVAKQREAQAAAKAAARAAERGATPGGGAGAGRTGVGGAPVDIGGGESGRDPSTDESVRAAQQLQVELDGIEAKRQQGQLGFLEYGRALQGMSEKGAKGLTTLQKGIATLVVAIDQVADAFANRATDALVEFVETGKFNFKSFAEALLKDITRIIIKLLVVKALEAAGFGGASTVNSAGSAAGARANGGTVQPDRSFLVGEDGPELFQPGRTGTIVPNAATTAAQQQPQVNVQVVNVDNPNAVPEAISNGQSDQAILNMLARNKDKAKKVLQ